MQVLDIILWLTAVSCSVGAFQVPARLMMGVSRTSPIFLSSEEPKRRRKRVQRRDAPDISASTENEVILPEVPDRTPVVPDLKLRDDAPVELTIQDIRDVVSGKSAVGDSSKQDTSERKTSSYQTTTVDDNNVSFDDSLKQLLADAREMRKDVGGGEEDGSFSIPESFRNILSMIVTIDFFVVCALLVWFLAGIFASYVLKNDDVQIAFNGIFQPVVQPALGILMIGSAAGGMYLSDDAFPCMYAKCCSIAFSSIYSRLQQGRKVRKTGVAISKASCFYYISKT